MGEQREDEGGAGEQGVDDVAGEAQRRALLAYLALRAVFQRLDAAVMFVKAIDAALQDDGGLRVVLVAFIGAALHTQPPITLQIAGVFGVGVASHRRRLLYEGCLRETVCYTRRA